jgi:hypothetical protein
VTSAAVPQFGPLRRARSIKIKFGRRPCYEDERDGYADQGHGSCSRLRLPNSREHRTCFCKPNIAHRDRTAPRDLLRPFRRHPFGWRWYAHGQHRTTRQLHGIHLRSCKRRPRRNADQRGGTSLQPDSDVDPGARVIARRGKADAIPSALLRLLNRSDIDLRGQRLVHRTLVRNLQKARALLLGEVAC